MLIRDETIDRGRPFDWGRVSADYARYRDIYPPAFYDRITVRGLCVAPPSFTVCHYAAMAELKVKK